MSRLKKILSNPFIIFSYLGTAMLMLILKLPYFRFIRDTASTETAITFRMWFIQKVLGINREAYWPMHHSSIVSFPKNVYAGIDTCPGYNPGCYVHGANKIFIGDYTQIAPNVGLMSGNHDIYDLSKQVAGKPILIGKYCWIGMGSVILPEVVLGDFTIVGAGAIVTKSFPEGYCVIVGNPARVLRKLDPENCVSFKYNIEYNGYIRAEKFSRFKEKNLNV
jgi:acetyltransferase-like isoleucine patch superfamily enzyme